jgi:hypothetical protein
MSKKDTKRGFVQSAETVPLWSARCWCIRQVSAEGPPSRVALQLRQYNHGKDGFVSVQVDMSVEEAREYADEILEVASEAVLGDRKRDRSKGEEGP